MTFTCSSRHNQIAKKIHDTLSVTEETRAPRKFFRVSETTMCGRKLAYGLATAPITNPFTPQTKLKMEMGDVLHNWIRDEVIPNYADFQVTDWSPVKEEEVFLYHEYDVNGVVVPMGGHIDGMLRTVESESPPALALLEVKTAGKFSYSGTKKAGCLDPSHWSNGYARQANRYVDLWNIHHPEEQIDQFCIFVWNTDGGNDNETNVPCRDYWFQFNPEELAKDLRLRARVVEEGGNQFSPDLVTRGFNDPSCFECTGCLFHDRCWG